MARRVRVLSEVVGVEWWATAAVVEARDTVAAASVVAVETVGVAGVAQVEGCTIRNSCTHSADNANYERAHHTTIRMLSSADRAHQRENIRGAVVQVGAAALAESTATARAGMMAPVRVAGPSGGKRALVEKAKAATAEVPVVAVVRTVTAVESGGAVVILALVVGGVAVVRWVAESVAAAASVADSVAAAASVATVVEAAAAAI